MTAKKTPPPETTTQVPTILLEMDEKGDWNIKSNVQNPTRILRLIGAKLTVRELE